MQPSFDPLAYVSYLRQRWRFIASVCLIAVVLAFGTSLMLPKRFTAKASLLIEPPGGSDPRVATAVSPVYLESLKSYEYFAASDTLFRKALDRFQLRGAVASSIESLKRRVLKVSKLRDTRVLEISVTLPDPRQAQSVVRFLADETLKLNEELLRAGDGELAAAASAEQAAAKRELDKLQAAWTDLAAREPSEMMEAEIKALVDLRSKVREQLIESRVEVAGDEQRATDNPGWKAAVAASRARFTSLQNQVEGIDRELRQKNARTAKASANRQSLGSELKTAQAAFDAASARLREIRTVSGSRGERLRIIDPGIVPERPSFPNVPLNLLIAFVAALVLSLLYLGFAFQMRPSIARPQLRSTATRANG
jgi:uncharacterized protein involved in exopolysaccharide biosynthesis